EASLTTNADSARLMSSQRAPLPCARWACACASSTSEHLRGSGWLDVDLVARGNEIAGDHILVSLPRSDHRVDASVGIDHDLEECGSRESEELADDARHVLLALEARRVAKAVGLGRLDEVFLMQRAVARREPSLEEQLLPLLDHPVAEVVEHHHLDRQVVGGRRLKLADGP